MAFVLMASVACVATAQRAPELLPTQVKLIAGGGAALANGKCPISGVTATDAAGDGCRATEIILGTAAATPGPRWAVADSKGNVFFSDYSNNLIRRVDAVTGIVTAVAGGATSSPGASTVCHTAISVDALGDGCLGTDVALLHPTALAFDAAGNLYFSEADYSSSATGGAHVRKIAATGGFITTTGTMTLILGQASNAKGYAANASTCTPTVATGCVTAANSYLDAPFGLAFDAAGNLYVAEEYLEALLVYNPATTGSVTINNVSVPAGTVAKLVGAYQATSTSAVVQDCPTAPASTNGCSYGTTTFGQQAAASLINRPYSLATDASGNLYFGNEFNNYVGKVASSGILSEFAGIQSAGAVNLARATAGTNGIGSPFGVATDLNSNVYFTDALNGVIWRVDADTSTQYVVAGGATAVCSTGDVYGNGCSATQATFGKSQNGKNLYASTTLPGPGIYGVSVDAYGNLFTGDTETNEVREVGTGAQFGVIFASTTDTLIVHYAPGDGPASATPYVISGGANNFSVGTPGNCTTNSDTSKDCPVPVKATPPSVTGAFGGGLTVSSLLGKTTIFPLSATYANSPVTNTAVAVTSGASCLASGSSYGSTLPLTLTATVTGTGTPTGKVQFYNNLTSPIGQPIALDSHGAASLTQTFPVGSYSITASYLGDSNFYESTSANPVTFSTTKSSYTFAYTVITPAPNTSPNCTSTASGENCTVPVGGTATYSFTLSQAFYNGTVSFSCSGLPAGASCIFSPQTITGTGCSTTSSTVPTVAMTVVTAKTLSSTAQAGFGGRWMLLSATVLGLLLAFARRRIGTRAMQLSIATALLLASSGLVACNSTSIGSPSTPKGISTVTVTAAGSDGSVQSLPVTLTIQ